MAAMVGSGFGSISWWGFTPAIDLQATSISEVSSIDESLSKDSNAVLPAISYLVVGAGDVRHILQTMARVNRHVARQRIDFYVVENNLECIARDLLLLSLVHEPQSCLGLGEKTEMFMELSGNSMVRNKTSDYLVDKATELIELVTDDDKMARVLPCVDLTLLKYKQRDTIESILKFWRNKERKWFDMEALWDSRLRQFFGVRYDARANVLDWDYSMNLKNKAPIINAHEYRDWRLRGIAFEMRDAEYNIPNRTLASGLVVTTKKGERKGARGYWGDIIVSPYISYGIESEDETFFKKQNDHFVHRSQQVVQHNVASLIHELMTGKRYSREKETPSENVQKITQILEETDFCEENNTSSPDFVTSITPVVVHAVGVDQLGELAGKSKWKHKFDAVYFSNAMVHTFTPELAAHTFADKANIVIETARFMLELKKDQSQEYVRRVVDMATAAGCIPCNKNTVDGEKDNYIHFQFERAD